MCLVINKYAPPATAICVANIANPAGPPSKAMTPAVAPADLAKLAKPTPARTAKIAVWPS